MGFIDLGPLISLYIENFLLFLGLDKSALSELGDLFLVLRVVRSYVGFVFMKTFVVGITVINLNF